MTAPASILVTCGEQRAALAIVRSLARAGHRVVVGSAGARSLAGASRAAGADLALGDPLVDPDGYRRRVAESVASRGLDLVIPTTEPAILALLPGRDALAPAVIPFPTLDAFLAASDKERVAEAAGRVGIAVPRQWVLAGPSGAGEVPADGRALVLKPGRSVRGGRKLGVSYLPAGGRIEDAVRALPAEAFPLLVQERVVGPAQGIFLLRRGGRTLATFAHRRLREKPPSGGVSVLRESVALDPTTLDRAEALLDQLGFEGVAMVELKVDRESGTPYVMEINGRFWGSLQLAIDAGVDFPRILVEAALGADPEPVRTYRMGVRTRWLLGDLDHLLLRMTRSAEVLALPPDAPGRLAVLGGFLTAFLPPTRAEVFRWSDPRPFVREVADWVVGVARG